MDVRRGLRLATVSAIALGLVLPVRSWAQARKKPAGVEAAAKAAVEIEEVTVVAQRREENIQEVPISITAISSEKIEQRGVTDLITLGEMTPNVRITEHYEGAASVSVAIRGVAQGLPSLTLQPATGLYIDGVYIAKIQGSNLGLEDVDHVEVLRGPQGTLYGRNTIGGALNIVTRKPTEERSIFLQTEAGNYDAFKGRLTLNAPLFGKNGLWQSDAIGTLSLRQNLIYTSHGPYTRNVSPTDVKASGSTGFEDLQRWETMTQLRWQPVKELTVDYAFEYHNLRTGGLAIQNTAVFPGSLTGPGGPFDLSAYVRPSRADSIGSNIGCLPGRDPECKRQQVKNDNRLHMLTAAYDLGQVGPLGNLTLKSISAYRSLYTDNDASEQDGTPLDIAYVGQRQDVQHWSEEVQVIGAAPRINYVVGAYYYGERGDENTPQEFFFGSISFLPRVTNGLESFAPYAQGTWTPPILGDRLSLTAGVRYTYEHSHTTMFFQCFRYILEDGSNGCNMHLAPSLDNWSKAVGANFSTKGAGFPELAPNASISYQATDDFMGYLRIARGFKSGGINAQSNDPYTMVPFKSEKLVQYELGFKSQWFDKRLQVNAAGYFSDYSDLQESLALASPAGVSAYTSNVESAEVWGSEVEVTALPVRGVEVAATYGLTLGTYKKWDDLVLDANGFPVIENGKPKLHSVARERVFAYQPEHAATLNLTYTAPPTASGIFSVSADLVWNDRQFFNPNSSTPGAWAERASSYYIVNGRAQFVSIPLTKGSLDIAVFGRNLFNRSYRVWGDDFTAFGYAINYFGFPRTFGVQLTYHLGES